MQQHTDFHFLYLCTKNIYQTMGHIAYLNYFDTKILVKDDGIYVSLID